MATRKTSGADKSTGLPDPAAIQEAFAQSFKGITDRMQNLDLTGSAATLLESGRKDIDMIRAFIRAARATEELIT